MGDNERQSPGEKILALMNEKGWGQQDISDISGIPLTSINQVIKGKRMITPRIAISLEQISGTPAETWLEDEYLYRLSLVERDEEGARRAGIYQFAPIRDMQRRNWLPKCKSMEELEHAVCEFFRINSIGEKPHLVAHARSGTEGPILTSEQLAWSMRAFQLAGTVSAEKYEKRRLKENLHSIRALAAQEDQVKEIPRFLADIGIRFVVVEHLPGTKIDGAAFWLNKTSPVIALSMRYDRIDYFWHTLLHELSHVLNEDAFLPDIDLAARDDGSDLVEERADREASEILIPEADLRSFIARTKPFFSKAKIRGFANRIKIHPGIVVGQLQHKRELSYNRYREALAKVRDALIGNVACDGWGQIPLFL